MRNNAMYIDIYANTRVNTFSKMQLKITKYEYRLGF